MSLFQPKQTVEDLSTIKLNPTPEVTRFACLVEGGKYEIANVAFATGALSAQADYFHIVNKTGTTFAIWLDIDAATTAPTGAIYTAADEKIEVDILSTDSAVQVAAKVKAVLDVTVAFDEFSIEDVGGGILKFTSELLGDLTDAQPLNADDSATGSIVVTVVDGIDSTLQNKHLLLSSGTINYFAWFNVGEEGSVPTVAGRTAIECKIDADISAKEVAVQLASRINASVAFKSFEQSGFLYIASVDNANTTDGAVGDSGFTISKIQDGSAGIFYPAMKPSDLKVQPDII